MYTPSPADPGPEPMSDDVRRVADGVLPFNRERMTERMAEATASFNATMERFAAAMVASTAPLVAAIRQFGAQIDWMEYQREGRTRPDGRPRRSGHRHRGMRDWHRRY